MAAPEELLAVVAQVRNELTEIQKTLSLEFAFTEAEHQGALFALQTGDDGGEPMTNRLKRALASAS